MKNARYTLKGFSLLIFMFALTSLAHAQTRTWVSGVGDDVNPCSRTAPCKTFAGAISKTADNGEIDALDPAGYGGVTITKNITIDGTGTLASVLVTGGVNGIVVNDGSTATPGTIKVTLRGLSFQGAASGLNAIRFTSGKYLNVLDCFITSFTGNGIDIALSTVGQVNVSNTVVKNCGGDGLAATSTAGIVKVQVARSLFAENGNGLHAKFNSRVFADRSYFSDNTSAGVVADGSTGVANISNSSLNGNGTNGVVANVGGIARIDLCDIIQNGGFGAFANGGELDTYSNSRIIGNGTDGCPGCTPKTPA